MKRFRVRYYFCVMQEDYIEAETYYEPYMEDYGSNAEYVLKDFFKKYGLKMTYFECDGSESGFEPDSRW